MMDNYIQLNLENKDNWTELIEGAIKEGKTVMLFHPAVRENINITNLLLQDNLKSISLNFPHQDLVIGFDDFRPSLSKSYFGCGGLMMPFSCSIIEPKFKFKNIPNRNFIWHGGFYEKPDKLVSDKPKKLSIKEKEKRKKKNKAQNHARRVQRLTPNPKIDYVNSRTNKKENI